MAKCFLMETNPCQIVGLMTDGRELLHNFGATSALMSARVRVRFCPTWGPDVVWTVGAGCSVGMGGKLIVIKPCLSKQPSRRDEPIIVLALVVPICTSFGGLVDTLVGNLSA